MMAYDAKRAAQVKQIYENSMDIAEATSDIAEWRWRWKMLELFTVLNIEKIPVL